MNPAYFVLLGRQGEPLAGAESDITTLNSIMRGYHLADASGIIVRMPRQVRIPTIPILISAFLVLLAATGLAGADMKRVVFDSDARTREKFPTEYVPALTHEFPVSEHKWTLQELNPDLPSDWSKYQFLVMELKSSTSQRFLLRLYTADGVRGMRFHQFGGGVWIRAAVPLSYFQNQSREGQDLAAVFNKPRGPFWMAVVGPFGPIQTVQALAVAMVAPVGNPTLEIRNVRLSNDDPGSTILDKLPVVDEFGQWIPAEYPGKIRSLEQLKSEWDREDKSCAPARSATVGTAVSPAPRPSPRASSASSRSMASGGSWIPTGTCSCPPESTAWEAAEPPRVSPAVKPTTPLSLRRSSGGTIGPPPHGGRLLRMEPGAAIRRQLGLQGQRYGDPPHASLGFEHGHQRAFERQADAVYRHVARRANRAGVHGHARCLLGGVCPRRGCVGAAQMAPLKDDPYLLGYFIGNEPAWPGRESELADMILAGKETETQRRLQAFLAGGDTPARRKEFVLAAFEHQLQTTNRAARKYDPHHLNLGIRFGSLPPDDVIRMGRLFDVYSHNIYEYAPDREWVAKLYQLTGRPLLIGEFHFGTPTRGQAAALMQVANERERGMAYRYYLEQVASMPSCIGAHWFAWLDESVTGRMDGKNYSFGYLDVTDRASDDFLAGIVATHKRMWAVHAGKIAAFSRKAKVQ